MRTANIFISLIFIAFTGFYSVLIWRLPSRDLPGTLGAGFVPWVLAGCLLFLTLLLLFGSILRRGDRGGEGREKYSPKELAGITGLIVLIFVYIQAMVYLGFIVASLIFLAILALIAGSRKVLEIALFSILTTAAVYFLFHHFFKVLLPGGEFF